MTIALWCVLAGMFTPIFATASAKLGRRFDNRHPREDLAALRGWRARANAAQLNGFEAFPPFAAAVIIATMQHAPQARLDALAVAWVLLRLVYLGFYVADLAVLRSLTWVAGIACVVAMFVLSA